MTRHVTRYARRTPPPPQRETPDDTFTNTAGIVAELKRLGRPKMAAWVERQGEENAANWRKERALIEQIHELRERLGLNQREERFDPTPPPEASD